MNTITTFALVVIGLIITGCVSPKKPWEPPPQHNVDFGLSEEEKAFRVQYSLCEPRYKTMTFDGVTYYQIGKGEWSSTPPKPIEGELSYMDDTKDRPPLLRGLWVDAEEALEKRGEETTPENVEKEILKLKIEKLMVWVIERRKKNGEPTDFDSVKAEVKELLKEYD